MILNLSSRISPKFVGPEMPSLELLTVYKYILENYLKHNLFYNYFLKNHILNLKLYKHPNTYSEKKINKKYLIIYKIAIIFHLITKKIIILNIINFPLNKKTLATKP